MAFPTTGLLDQFTRGDEGPPPSASWTTMDQGHKVVSNQCDTNAVGEDTFVSGYNASTYGPDSECYFTAVVVNDFGEGVFARLTTLVLATTDGYLYWRSSTNVTRLYRTDNGGFTQLGADGPAFTIANGDKLGIECIDDSIKGYIDDGGAGWAEEIARTEGTYGDAGYLGIRSNPGAGDTGTIDDFGGGDDSRHK